mmetsp:Transcript_7991/g.24684  ORF Transcript_7991/g.24684 Transcript_7991/m.24684 type:complete len:323 (+) Transcript_7991:59-1027(+)
MVLSSAPLLLLLSCAWSSAFVLLGKQSTTRTRLGAATMEKVEFSKYQGLGNDFILVDARSAVEPPLSPEQAARLCDRNFGVGADGVIFALKDEDADFRMRIYNSDSSEPEMCGNGIRCLARFLKEELQETGHSDGAATTYAIATGAGLITPTVLDDGRVAVDMGEPELRGPLVPTTLATNSDERVIEEELGLFDLRVTCVSMGNPHAVAFVDDLDDVDLPVVGPQCEHHAVFPARVNTEFVQVVDRGTLKMKVWERGAGPTLACGTGACATAVAGVLTGRSDRSAVVQLPGGDLDIEWHEHNNRITMTGPAELVFSGSAAIF